MEARTAGGSDWTTLPDVAWPHEPVDGLLLPVLARHPSVPAALPDGPSRRHVPAAGDDRVLERRHRQQRRLRAVEVDLTPYAGNDVELSLTSTPPTTSCRTWASSSTTSSSSTGEGSTSFEPEATPSTAGPRPGRRPVARQRRRLDHRHRRRRASARRERVTQSSPARPEIWTSCPATSGRYPLRAAAGSSTTSTASVRAGDPDPADLLAGFFTDAGSGDSVVVHDCPTSGSATALHSTLEDIWLNEGFATYAEWLWSEHEGWDPPRPRPSTTSTRASPRRLPVVLLHHR